ncbi:hypothetical protein LSTR_LSTR016023 [Laodelphax striatellus]|uniref:Uncharacterized protein n=1 Tax=Laodelphax striatellus TaxID=195883 RepID=A0A482XLP3_LAOST|nr:hypothetical protein LSTR_LSTR016023 [Laodelphax striatellus]
MGEGVKGGIGEAHRILNIHLYLALCCLRISLTAERFHPHQEKISVSDILNACSVFNPGMNCVIPDVPPHPAVD